MHASPRAVCPCLQQTLYTRLNEKRRNFFLATGSHKGHHVWRRSSQRTPEGAQLVYACRKGSQLRHEILLRRKSSRRVRLPCRCCILPCFSRLPARVVPRRGGCPQRIAPRKHGPHHWHGSHGRLFLKHLSGL